MSGKQNCLSNASYTKPGTPESCDFVNAFLFAIGPESIQRAGSSDLFNFLLVDCLLYQQKVKKCNSESDIIPTID
jgi:hypothetical protein